MSNATKKPRAIWGLFASIFSCQESFCGYFLLVIQLYRQIISEIYYSTKQKSRQSSCDELIHTILGDFGQSKTSTYISIITKFLLSTSVLKVAEFLGNDDTPNL